ncbi:ras family small GTPase, partial [Reticulomyxa filosa]
VFMPFLIGTKYDLFDGLPDTYKQQLTAQARKFAQKMHAPLVYCSSAKSINVDKIFMLIVIKVFNMDTKIKEFHNELTEPILEYNFQVVRIFFFKNIINVVFFLRNKKRKTKKTKKKSEKSEKDEKSEKTEGADDIDVEKKEKKKKQEAEKE